MEIVDLVKDVLEVPQQHRENCERFIKNTESWIEEKEVRTRFVPIAIRAYQRLTNNFQKNINVVDSLDGLGTKELKAKWDSSIQNELMEKHNIDFEEEMMDAMAFEMTLELKEVNALHSFQFEKGKVIVHYK